MLTYVDSQGVVLENGGEASVELDYDETADKFIVTADCDSYIYRYKDFVEENYPDTDPEEHIRECEELCGKISGIYTTLWSINSELKRYCNPTDYYNFTWEYDDGTPVE